MLDEKDLQAIAQLIRESEQRTAQFTDSKIKESEERMNAKIEESASQTLKDAMQGASVLMESYFEPKFKLLAEGIQGLKETQIPKDRFEELEEEVTFLRSVVRQHSREIEKLKHA